MQERIVIETAALRKAYALAEAAGQVQQFSDTLSRLLQTICGVSAGRVPSGDSKASVEAFLGAAWGSKDNPDDGSFHWSIFVDHTSPGVLRHSKNTDMIYNGGLIHFPADRNASGKPEWSIHT